MNFGRTQSGNNNAYCQDNEINWVDWSLLDHNIELMNFVRHLLHLRRRAPGLRRDTFLKGARGRIVSTRMLAGVILPGANWKRAIGMMLVRNPLVC